MTHTDTDEVLDLCRRISEAIRALPADRWDEWGRTATPVALTADQEARAGQSARSR